MANPFIVLTDIIASVSGDDNEVLTMTTPIATANMYRRLHFIIDEVICEIASNTTTTITLITQTDSFDDFTGETAEILQYYATLYQTKKRLRKALTTVQWNNDEIEEALEEVSGDIDEELNLSTPVRTERHIRTLRKICIDVAAMCALQKRHFIENNQIATVVPMWTVTPEFTFAHLRKLRKIRERVLRTRVARVFSIDCHGVEIIPPPPGSNWGP